MKLFVVTSQWEGEDTQIDGIFFTRRSAKNWVFNEAVKLGLYDLEVVRPEIHKVKVTDKVKRNATLHYIRQCLDDCGMDDEDERKFLKSLRRDVECL